MNVRRSLRLILPVLMALVGVLCLAVVVDAQANLTISPAEISIAATRTRDLVVTRTLLLRITEPVTNLQIMAHDLTRTDDQAVLSIADIHFTQPVTQLSAGNAIYIPVSFDLRNMLSGEFKGELLIVHDNGEQSIPVTITLKDAVYWPLAVLSLGVVFGLIITAYRNQGKLRDEVLVRMGQVRTESLADTELADSFRSVILKALLEAESALQAKKWSVAEDAVARAETIWLKWRSDSRDWIAQLNYAQELLSSDDLQSDKSRYLITVARSIREAMRDAPDLPDGPRELRQKLNSLADQLSQYLRLQAEIDSLGQFPDLTRIQRDKLASFQNQLDGMLPDEVDEYRKLQVTVTQTRDEWKALIPKAPDAPTTRDVIASVPDLPVQGPSLSAAQPDKTRTKGQLDSQNAKWRLVAFRWGGYVFAVILLVGTGFAQTYISKPTFGDNWWFDYFSLFLWGFGAEASRAAITDFLRGFDLPGLR